MRRQVVRQARIHHWNFLTATEPVWGHLSLKYRFLYGPEIDQVFHQEGTATSHWLLGDHLGTTREVVDDSGTLQRHYVFDAYGNLQGSTAHTMILFAGRELDAVSGLYYVRARWYDPRVGRWVSEDPIGFAGGDTNLARYVGNSPVNYTDPSGLVWAPAFDPPAVGQPDTSIDAIGAFITALPGALGTTFSNGNAYDSVSGAACGFVDTAVWAVTVGTFDPRLRDSAAIFGNEDDAANGAIVGEYTLYVEVVVATGGVAAGAAGGSAAGGTSAAAAATTSGGGLVILKLSERGPVLSQFFTRGANLARCPQNVAALQWYRDIANQYIAKHSSNPAMADNVARQRERLQKIAETLQKWGAE